MQKPTKSNTSPKSKNKTPQKKIVSNFSTNLALIWQEMKNSELNRIRSSEILKLDEELEVGNRERLFFGVIMMKFGGLESVA